MAQRLIVPVSLSLPWIIEFASSFCFLKSHSQSSAQKHTKFILASVNVSINLVYGKSSYVILYFSSLLYQPTSLFCTKSRKLNMLSMTT